MNTRIEALGDFLKKNLPKTLYDFSVETPDIRDICLLTDYLGAVIALDYGFWRLEKGRFKVDYSLLKGEHLKGATFLWTKSRLKLEENPYFFKAVRLANLSSEEFREWLEDDTGRIPFKDPDRRYSLILDYGRRLLEVGSIQRIYENENASLKGFCSAMENFDAYSDFPFCKKAHLLCKIMERIGRWRMIEDPDFRKIPPIDYHLVNMAWKLGLIELLSSTEQRLVSYELLPPGDEFLIRTKSVDAYLKLAERSGLDPYRIDDIMWMESRKNCQREPYTCDECLFDSVCLKDKVGFPLVETHRY